MSNVRPHSRSVKLAISSYWSAPIPGGYSRSTLELIAVGRFETETGKRESNAADKEKLDQLSIPCDDKCIDVSYPNNADLWGQFSAVRSLRETTSKPGANKVKTSVR
jgi:hypothetical protein